MGQGNSDPSSLPAGVSSLAEWPDPGVPRSELPSSTPGLLEEEVRVHEELVGAAKEFRLPQHTPTLSDRDRPVAPAAPMEKNGGGLGPFPRWSHSWSPGSRTPGASSVLNPLRQVRVG